MQSTLIFITVSEQPTCSKSQVNLAHRFLLEGKVGELQFQIKLKYPVNKLPSTAQQNRQFHNCRVKFRTLMLVKNCRQIKTTAANSDMQLWCHMCPPSGKHLRSYPSSFSRSTHYMLLGEKKSQKSFFPYKKLLAFPL